MTSGLDPCQFIWQVKERTSSSPNLIHLPDELAGVSPNPRVSLVANLTPDRTVHADQCDRHVSLNDVRMLRHGHSCLFIAVCRRKSTSPLFLTPPGNCQLHRNPKEVAKEVDPQLFLFCGVMAASSVELPVVPIPTNLQQRSLEKWHSALNQF